MLRKTARHFILGIGVPLSLLLAVATAAGAVDVYRVDEDWELVLASPSYEKGSPQFETTMSPLGHNDQGFARVTWNYVEEPDFVPGGLQVQAWNGSLYERESHESQQNFWVADERVTWTQQLTVSDGHATFRVKDGQSATWGAFGGDNTKVCLSGSVSNLNSYNSDCSASKSGVTFGGNRVLVLRLNQVRYYGASGELLATESTPKVVVGNQHD